MFVTNTDFKELKINADENTAMNLGDTTENIQTQCLILGDPHTTRCVCKESMEVM